MATFTITARGGPRADLPTHYREDFSWPRTAGEVQASLNDYLKIMRREGTQTDLIDRGRQLAARLFAGAPRDRTVPPDMMRYTLGHLFGDVWQDDRLSLEDRSLITCAVLIALGREAELRLHLRGARNLEHERGTLEALCIHVGHYAGWPTAATSLRLLDEVWEMMDAATDDDTKPS